MSVTLAPTSSPSEQWRQKLAGLTDPDASPTLDSRTSSQWREAGVGFVLCLCDLFGDDLDRLKIWERIGTGLAAAVATVHDGDTDRFADLCLTHVKADFGRAAAHDTLHVLLAGWSNEQLGWRQGFVRYLSQHTFAVIAHARRQWQDVKQGRAEARALKEGGTLSTGEIIVKGNTDA